MEQERRRVIIFPRRIGRTFIPRLHRRMLPVMTDYFFRDGSEELRQERRICEASIVQSGEKFALGYTRGRF
jgi:hypothetical protein